FASDMCKDAKHPQGRTFSIFTTSGKVNNTVIKILTTYNNGYVIDSLYDLGSNPGSAGTPPEEYRRYITSEVRKMMTKAKQYNFKYQLAIPASASAHEFESKGGRSTGYAQIDYVKASYEVFKQYKVKLDPNFVGVALWAWADQRWSGGKRITPSIPNEETQDFLAKNL
ncbi:hypothetical protein ACQUW5_14140, partial [Legionella sp. CNM-1927-20]|uniref:hypothetical protein n=1 Tax=Legionella sp. CNM-1927-20 TaxID=3422221 RepID=UPI00403AAB37